MTEPKSAIYVIRNRVTGRIYVGSAMNATRRFIEHRRDLKAGNHANAKLQSSWCKHGAEAFEFQVIEIVEDPARLLAREQHWIDTMEAVGKGYNLNPTAGSNLGLKMSNASRQRMSEAAKGKPKSPEHVEKVRQALKGRTMTDEQRMKMRLAKLGKKRAPHSEETRRKMSEAAKGRTFSVETRQKMAAAQLGRKHTPETIERMKAAKAALRQEKLI